MIGLCKRAGKTVGGADAVRNAVRQGKAKLVLLDGGISPASMKAVGDSCAYYTVPWKLLPPGQLGRASGRAEQMALAITDQGFANAISEKIPGNNCGGAWWE